MDKGRDFINLMEYYETFDVPLKGRDDDIVDRGNNSIHLSEVFFRPASIALIPKAEEIIVSRGAVRGKDYLITLSAESNPNQLSMPIVTIHTTTDFLTQEDYTVREDGSVTLE